MMKVLKSTLLLLAVLCTMLSTQSCTDECDDIVCENGGACIEGICDCPDGFTGNNCEFEEPCFGVICENGGTCTQDGTCSCPDGFTGSNCEIADPCFGVTCENGGTCVEGVCDCPEGYIGTNCESFDASQVQALLEGGKTPKELFDGGIILDSLYGKNYADGIIFYLNTDDGTGMVAATEDQSESAEWGCFGTDIMNLDNVQDSPEDPETAVGTRIGDGAANTAAILECTEIGIAARLCDDLIINDKSDWFLPSRGELNLMYTNLKDNGDLGGFAADKYWSSTEYDGDGAWFQFFGDGFQSSGNTVNLRYVRAARAF